MKFWKVAGVLGLSVFTGFVVEGSMAANTEKSFGSDVAFLKKHMEVVLLANGDAQVALAPSLQGRVMTSTTRGKKGPSFGWLNYRVIEEGVLPLEKRKGRLEDHIFVFGGEERFWMGPEGGQYALFFAPGAKFEFADWHTPAFLDTEPFEVSAHTSSSATFRRNVEFQNYSGTPFKVAIERTVSLLQEKAISALLGQPLPAKVRAVAYETDNRVANKGDQPWTKDRGLISIWLLGMYNPSPATTIVIPFKPGPETELGQKVNDTYFGKVPPEYLVVKEKVLFFKGDGTHRSKIGISPARSCGIAGSYDAELKVLTLVTYNAPEKHAGYVNSMWELQKDPYGGDALNSYNDGSPAPGQPPLGPFYEIETSSPAAALGVGETLRHVQRTVHLQGADSDLDAIAQKLLGASLTEIKQAFGK